MEIPIAKNRSFVKYIGKHDESSIGGWSEYVRRIKARLGMEAIDGIESEGFEKNEADPRGSVF